MSKLFQIAIVALMMVFASQAHAAMSKAGVPAGAWCSIPNKDSDWTYFKRDKCTQDENDSGNVTLILKANGDYIFTGVGDEVVCKVNPKSYFKGWADYNCITYGGSDMKSKTYQKFLLDISNGHLMLSPN